MPCSYEFQSVFHSVVSSDDKLWFLVLTPTPPGKWLSVLSDSSHQLRAETSERPASEAKTTATHTITHRVKAEEGVSRPSNAWCCTFHDDAVTNPLQSSVNSRDHSIKPHCKRSIWVVFCIQAYLIYLVFFLVLHQQGNCSFSSRYGNILSYKLMVFKYTKQVIMGEELRGVIKQENIPLLQNQYSALRDSLSFNSGLLLTVMTPFLWPCWETK